MYSSFYLRVVYLVKSQIHCGSEENFHRELRGTFCAEAAPLYLVLHFHAISEHLSPWNGEAPPQRQVSADRPLQNEDIRRGIEARNRRVLAAFRQELGRSNLAAATAGAHLARIEDFAQAIPLDKTPPTRTAGYGACGRADLHQRAP